MSEQREKSTAVGKNYYILRRNFASDTAKISLLVLSVARFINKFRYRMIFSYFSIDNRTVL